MKKINYKPLANRLLVEPLPDLEEDKKVGEIHLADSAIIFQRGKVLRVGRGEIAMQTGDIIPMETNEGNTILYRREAPFLPIRLNGQEYRLMRENDIECVIE